MSYMTLWRNRTPNASTSWTEPFAFSRDLDRWFDRDGSADLGGAWGPVVDVRETEDSLVLEAELPGLRSEDVSVSVEDGVLTVSGEKKREIEEGTEGNYHFTERRFGRFERSFRLPRSLNTDAVQAEFSSGVLTIVLPKAEEAKPRRIDVKVK
jgi:HSP20 family protein